MPRLEEARPGGGHHLHLPDRQRHRQGQRRSGALAAEDAFRGFNAGNARPRSRPSTRAATACRFSSTGRTARTAGSSAGTRRWRMLAAHLDVLPTLAELCAGAVYPTDLKPWTASSFAAQLADAQAPPHRDPRRRSAAGRRALLRCPARSGRRRSVAKDQWRLVDGEAALRRAPRTPDRKRNMWPPATRKQVAAELRALYEELLGGGLTRA